MILNDELEKVWFKFIVSVFGSNYFFTANFCYFFGYGFNLFKCGINLGNYGIFASFLCFAGNLFSRTTHDKVFPNFKRKKSIFTNYLNYGIIIKIAQEKKRGYLYDSYSM